MHYIRLLVLAALAAASAGAQDVDLLIRNGRVLDGSGNPDFRADIAIRGDTILALGKLGDMRAQRTIDASGLVVAPGFIDMHSHADRALAGDDREARKAHNLVAQGITTVVGSPDGRNRLWPISKEIAAFRRMGIALNIVPMVGHGTVRGVVMEDDYERVATDEEVRRMQALVREGMEDGAWGIGAGPEYRPGRFSTTEELVALAQVVAEYDGFYYAHQRSQSPLPRWQTPSILEADGWWLTGTDGMKETIRIGREAGIRVVGSHIKAKGPTTWGHASIDIRSSSKRAANASRSISIKYPFETFGGGPTGVISSWGFAAPGTDRSGGLDAPLWRTDGIFADHKENLKKNLADPVTGPLLITDIEHVLDLRGGAARHIIVVFAEEPSLVGKTLAEVARDNGKSVIDTLGGLRDDGNG